ncbi:signal recognition particle receptor beta subunit-domain-containing protein [Lipomyces japonicus]|uniref:signal recognition particle receptor beta subunit-domain-containing protein n=1 Tax=Lipomyces japonicus TaxID=56871 RepID=UPI0034CE95F3
MSGSSDKIELVPVEQVSPTSSNFFVGVLVILALIIVVYFVYEFIFRKTAGVAAGGPSFIIAGPSSAGKTSLFTLIHYGKKADTVPSIEQNVTTHFRLPSVPDTAKPFILIDTPGHQKLRHGFFDALRIAQAAKTAKGVVFVIDAGAVSRPEKLREAAEYLYDVLQITEKTRGGIDILVAANKSELFTAVPAKRLRSLFETELDKIRKSRAKSVGKVGGEKQGQNENEEVDDAEWPGDHDKQLKLEDLESEITVIDGSVARVNTDGWIRWMEERAVN